MYLVDVRRGVVLRLSQDGFTLISENKMKDYFTDKFEDINDRINDNLLHIYGMYDAKFGEYVISMGKIVIVNPNDNRPETILESETIGFSEYGKRWNSFYTYDELENMCEAMTGFVSFKKGGLWHHNRGGGDNTTIPVHYGEFYGINHKSHLWLISNDHPSNIKVYNTISQESDDVWTTLIETKEGQSTSIIESDFDTRENIHYAQILNDINSPGGLIEGDRIRGASALLKLTSNAIASTLGTRISKLFAVTVNNFFSYRSNK